MRRSQRDRRLGSLFHGHSFEREMEYEKSRRIERASVEKIGRIMRDDAVLVLRLS
jgi:hypothetical protein